MQFICHLYKSYFTLLPAKPLLVSSLPLQPPGLPILYISVLNLWSPVRMAPVDRLGPYCYISNRPLTNRGGTLLYRIYTMLTKPDYLTIVFPKTFSEVHHESILSACNHFLSYIRLSAITFATPRNFYSYTYDILDNWGRVVGFLAWGGNGGTICISLSGVACSRLSRVDFYIISEWLQAFDGSISRLDLAFDFDGLFHVEHTKAEYGLYDYPSVFHPNSSAPSRSLRLINDLGSNKGCTLYIGSRESSTFTRLYEKGKQLGNPTSTWLRLETEFRGSNCYVPINALVNPDYYFAAVSYRHAALLDIVLSSESPRIHSRKRALTDSSAHILEHIRQSYGQYINVLRGLHSDSELLDLIQRDGIPARLRKL